MDQLAPAAFKTAAAIMTTFVVALGVPYARSLTTNQTQSPKDWDLGIELSITGFCFCFGSVLNVLADLFLWLNNGGAHNLHSDVWKLGNYSILAFFAVGIMLMILRSHQVAYGDGSTGASSLSLKNNAIGGLALTLGLIIH